MAATPWLFHLHCWCACVVLNLMHELLQAALFSIFTLKYGSHPLALPSALLVRMCGAEFDA